MTPEQILYEKSETMVHEILAALADARDDDEIRAVIITATGRGFCSGALSRPQDSIVPRMELRRGRQSARLAGAQSDRAD